MRRLRRRPDWRRLGGIARVSPSTARLVIVPDLQTLGLFAAAAFALIAASSVAFDLVRLFGAAYLIYLGVRTLFAKDNVVSLRGSIPRSPAWTVFRQGVLVNVLNPKVALFFLVFLPQFISPARGAAPTQILVLGTVFFTIALAMDIVYAVASGSVGALLRRRPQFIRLQRYLTGSVYIGLGLSAGATGRSRG